MPAILGIDAAWTAHNNSGVALVECRGSSWRLLAVAGSYAEFLNAGLVDSQPQAHRKLCNVDGLLDASARLLGAQPDVVAIDMPLSTRPITGRRQADDEVSRAFGPYWCSAHSPSAERPGKISDEMRLAFETRGYLLATSSFCSHALIEVYPHPALLELTAELYRLPYKFHKCRKYWPDLERAKRRELLLEVWGKIVSRLDEQISGVGSLLALGDLDREAPGSQWKSWEDKLDAVICAWVGICFLEKRACAYGDGSAAIWVPKSARFECPRTVSTR